ncbi:HalOD1 output domain-containing protein [Halobaculum lipolyticum]|uniref:HalOD1 output domain-containing protein n=1 Tax=Halobaculum lipolyticum TaxID=3032001 RepID=A0ABD5W8Q9_9EURY|nr:HalOD1 output domain-containing protein [Halobaculum sp. DT31]
MTADHTASGGGNDDSLTIRSDWTAFDRPSTGVVLAVSEAVGRDPETLPVLNDRIDGDALDTVIAESGGDVEVSFSYAGTIVRVSSGGAVVVERDE